MKNKTELSSYQKLKKENEELIVHPVIFNKRELPDLNTLSNMDLSIKKNSKVYQWIKENIVEKPSIYYYWIKRKIRDIIIKRGSNFTKDDIDELEKALTKSNYDA